MNNKKTTSNNLLADYRSRAASRRASSTLTTSIEMLPDGINRKGGVVTVKLAPNAKPLAKLGGATKVFGPSNIWIPEFKRSH